MIWLQFILCVALLMVAGSQLAKYANILSVKTKMGGLWIGLVLVATITSVPETVAATSAAAVYHNADLALSTLYGGNTFNLALIGVMDIMYRKHPLLKMVSRRQGYLLLSACLLLGLAGLAIFFGSQVRVTLGPVGLISLTILLLYIFMLYQQGRSAQPDGEDNNDYLDHTLRSLAVKLSLAGLGVVLAGFWLAYIGERIAVETAMSSSFVGNLFLGVATSAPEVMVSLAALRIGAVQLAVANLVGSVMYRSAIVIIPDIFDGDGPILSTVSSDSLILITAALMMSFLVLAGLWWPGRRKTFSIMSWYTPPIIGIYFWSFYLLLDT